MSCLVNSFQVTLKPTGWTEIFYQLNFQVNVQIVLGSSYQAFDSPKTEGTAGCILTPCVVIPVVDLHSKILDAPAPRSKFFHFHAVFGKIFIFMQFLGKFGKIICHPPPPPHPWVGASSSEKFWIRHCIPSMHDTFQNNSIESMGVSVAIPGVAFKIFFYYQNYSFVESNQMYEYKVNGIITHNGNFLFQDCRDIDILRKRFQFMAKYLSVIPASDSSVHN